MTRAASSIYFSPPHPRRFRDALSRFASGVTVITARKKDAEALGVTISSFAALSLKPPLILFCLDEKSRAQKAFRRKASFVVNILAEDQKKLARLFSASSPQVQSTLFTPASRYPVLKGAIGVLICNVEKKLKGGDHTIIIGRIKKIALSRETTRPLLHTQRNYWSLGKIRR